MSRKKNKNSTKSPINYPTMQVQDPPFEYPRVTGKPIFPQMDFVKPQPAIPNLVIPGSLNFSIKKPRGW